MIEDKKIITFLLGLPIIVAIIIISSLWHTWFSMDLWNWFIVPYFKLEKVTMLQMFFIILGSKAVVTYRYREKTYERPWKVMAYSHANILVVWIMAVVSRWYFL